MHACTARHQDFLIEDAGVGTAWVAELKPCGSTVIAVKADENKKAALSLNRQNSPAGSPFPAEPPDGSAGSWRQELFAFPLSRFDDQGRGQRQPGPGTSNRQAYGWSEKSAREFEVRSLHGWNTGTRVSNSTSSIARGRFPYRRHSRVTNETSTVRDRA